MDRETHSSPPFRGIAVANSAYTAYPAQAMTAPMTQYLRACSLSITLLVQRRRIPSPNSQQTHPDRPGLRQDRRRRSKYPCSDHPVHHQEHGADQTQLSTLREFDRLDRADISLGVEDLCISIFFAIDIAWRGRRHVARKFALRWDA